MTGNRQNDVSFTIERIDTNHPEERSPVPSGTIYVLDMLTTAVLFEEAYKKVRWDDLPGLNSIEPYKYYKNIRRADEFIILIIKYDDSTNGRDVELFAMNNKSFYDFANANKTGAKILETGNFCFLTLTKNGQVVTIPVLKTKPFRKNNYTKYYLDTTHPTFTDVKYERPSEQGNIQTSPLQTRWEYNNFEWATKKTPAAADNDSPILSI